MQFFYIIFSLLLINLYCINNYYLMNKILKFIIGHLTK